MTPYIEWTGETSQRLNTGMIRLLNDGQKPGDKYKFVCGVTELKVLLFHGVMNFLPDNLKQQCEATHNIRDFLQKAGYAGALWERRNLGVRYVYIPVDDKTHKDLLIFN